MIQGEKLMGKDSEYYKEKTYQQKEKLAELLMELPECVKKYINERRLSLQPSTLIMYCYDYMTFFKFLIEKNPVYKAYKPVNFKYEDLDLITSDDITEYMLYLEYNNPDNSVPNADRHINDKKAITRKLSALRGLYQYHFEHNNVKNNPMLLVKLPKIKKDKNIIRLNQQETVDLLNCANNSSYATSVHMEAYRKKTVLRDNAIITLLLGTGMRVSECAGLDITDVNFTDNSLVIVRKGGGQDVIYFNDEVSSALSDYIENERVGIKAREGHEKALFYSMQSKRISVDAIQALVKKFARMTVPNKKITPHKLRSTFGTALYRETGDIRLVADVLGHISVNTTTQFYSAIEDEHKRRAADYKIKH